MNEYELNLIEKLVTAGKYAARLEARLDALMALTLKAEEEDAEIRASSRTLTPIYGGTVRCDDINSIFGWARSEKAVALIEKRRGEDEG